MTRRRKPARGALRAGSRAPRGAEHALDCECAACSRRLRRARSGPPPRVRGIDPGSLPPLPDGALPLLGELSDREVAARTGTTARTVAAHRKARGIPAVKPGPRPAGGVKRDRREVYYLTPAEQLEVHLAIEATQRTHSEVAAEQMLGWARRQRSAPTETT